MCVVGEPVLCYPHTHSKNFPTHTPLLRSPLRRLRPDLCIQLSANDLLQLECLFFTHYILLLRSFHFTSFKTASEDDSADFVGREQNLLVISFSFLFFVFQMSIFFFLNVNFLVKYVLASCNGA